jgi:hypothetical protein
MNVQVKESYFWQQVKAGLDDASTHMCRIENTAGTGISDVNACCRGQEVWLELKVFHGRRLYFRNSQKSWIVRRSEVGGRIFILARNEDTLIMYDAAAMMQCEAIPGNDGKSFSVDVDKLPPPIYVCHKPFKWAELRERLFGFR